MNICSHARNLVVSDPTFANLPKKEAPLAVPGGLCPLILAMHPRKRGGLRIRIGRRWRNFIEVHADLIHHRCES